MRTARRLLILLSLLGFFAFLLEPLLFADAPLFIPVRKALESQAVVKGSNFNFVVYRRNGYGIRIWTQIGSEGRSAFLSPGERVTHLVSGGLFIGGKHLRYRKNAGDLWLVPKGSYVPSFLPDHKETPVGFSIDAPAFSEKSPEGVSPSGDKAQFRNLPNLLKHFPLAEAEDFDEKLVLQGKRLGISLIQVQGTLPPRVDPAREHVFYIERGRMEFRISGVLYPASAGYLVIVPAAAEISISNRGPGAAVLLMIALNPASTETPAQQ